METGTYDFGTIRFHWRIASFPLRFHAYRGKIRFLFPSRLPLVSICFPFRTLYTGNEKRSQKLLDDAKPRSEQREISHAASRSGRKTKIQQRKKENYD